MWISNNYEEYCDFTEMMHSVDGIGFERVFNFASKLAPGFKKAVILRMKDDRATDFTPKSSCSSQNCRQSSSVRASIEILVLMIPL